MIEVFKTNITDTSTAQNIISELKKVLPDSVINFDLDDCDNILRIDSKEVVINKTLNVLLSKGFYCEVLPD